MKLPPVFTAFCLTVLLAFAAAKVEGFSLFGSTGLAGTGGGAGGGTGGHGGGLYLGSHK